MIICGLFNWYLDKIPFPDFCFLLDRCKTKKESKWIPFCGAYGTRTRDPMRDRLVF